MQQKSLISIKIETLQLFQYEFVAEPVVNESTGAYTAHPRSFELGERRPLHRLQNSRGSVLLKAITFIGSEMFLQRTKKKVPFVDI